MSFSLRIVLIVFSIIWFIVVSSLLKKEKIPVKYSIIWYACSLVLLIVGLFPGIMEFFKELFGFQTISNMVIGVILTLLLIITIVLTIIIFEQNRKIILLIQQFNFLKTKLKK